MIFTVAKWGVAHFERYRQRTKFQFLWRISLEGVLVPIFLATACDFVFSVSPRVDLASLSPPQLFIGAVIVSPFIETVVLQVFPVMVARRLGLSFWGCVITSLLPFAVVHVPSGLSTFIFAGLVSGFYIAFTYVHWRGVSFRSALWMASGSHAIHNFVVVLLALASA